jgi:amino acid adenylation domain-containing protein
MENYVGMEQGIETVRDALDQMAARRGEAIFLISPETGRTLTFRRFRDEARAVSLLLRRAGLEQGDKVAFLMDNGLFTVQLFLGTMYGGLVSVPLNVRAGVEQLAYTLNHCDARVVFVEEQYTALAQEILAGVNRPVQLIRANVDAMASEWEQTFEDLQLETPAPEDIALLMYTSGSTGQPKAAVHSHRTVLAHGRNSISSHQLSSADRSLLVLPLYHINAECVTLIPTLMSGGSVVVPHRFIVSQFWDWLDDYRCTWTAVVPTIISQLLDWKDPQEGNRRSAFARIRFVRSSSAPLSPAQQHEFLDKFDLLLIQAMGSSEAGNIFSNPLPPGENKIGSPGLAWGFETRIVNREGFDVKPGESGEVLIRGEAVMQGYYKDPEGTVAVLDAEGWLHTGDLAYQDESGYFFILGRSKELIIKGGMNIAPRQIDDVLESHPAVLEAAVIGVPDRHLGEDLVAFVVLRAGIDASEGELLAFCERRLGPFKTPTWIHFAEDLPKGPSGKVQRLRLLDNVAQPSALKSAPFNGNHGLARGTSAATSDGMPPIEAIIATIWAELLKQPQVDLHSNFFALGGHSLLAIQCLARVREKLSVALSLSDFFEHPTIAQQTVLVERRLGREEAATEQNLPTNSQETIPLRNRTLPCPLSPAQRRLWFLEQLNPGLPIYNESEAVRLQGELNVNALEQALNTIIERHEILRSTIQISGGEPTAVVHEKWPLRLKKIDLSDLPPIQRQAEVERLLIAEPRRLYHLEVEPGIRATLLRLGPQEHVFILLMHHLVCDWSSEGVLWRELSALYRALVRGESPTLPNLPIQHGDYAAWQQKRIAETNFSEDLAFWEANLREAPALLELPTDRPRPRAISDSGGRQRFRIDRTLADALRESSRQEKTSLFTFFAAALNTMLYRYSNQEDILLGIPMADRDRQELQPLIGFLTQSGVLRTKLSGDMTFRELLAAVQKGVLGLYGHRAVPFDQVVNKLRPERNLSYAPLAQVWLNWRDRDQQLAFIGMDALAVESLLSETKTSKFDLVLLLTDLGDDICVEMEYSADLFDDSRIERMFGHYQKLLEAAAGNPDRRLAELPMLTDAEAQQLLIDWNQTQIHYPKNKCVHELIEDQAQRAPEAVAAVSNNAQLTYGQLNNRANQLAHHLQKLGVGPDTLVAVCMERSVDMLVGLLGILKAGGAYVPLDPSYPKERLAFTLNDSGTALLLTHERLLDQLHSSDCRVLCMDTDWEVIAKSPTENPTSGVGPENLAYVIYTSGSTGEPKGVQLMHDGLLNLIFWHRRTYQVSPDDRATQLAGVGFDASVWELWPYLTAGACIYMPDEDTRLLPERLRDWLVEHEITLTFVPTPLAEALIALPWPSKITLRAMLTGGDRLTRYVPSSLPFPVVNHYGPSESTVVTTCAAVDIEGQSAKPPPIGKPIANTQIYVLDNHLKPLPIGIPGELHVGGTGLARGYLNRPALTAEKFILDPFSGNPEARLYKTGDMVRYLPTGSIEFLGRNDDQVKIRGFRIELGEIESVLATHPKVRAAVVMAREIGLGEKRLVAYVTTHSISPTDTELRRHLKRQMPDHMVPSAFVILEQFPLSSNGKVDRLALPAPDFANTLTDAADTAPVTEVEKTVAGILAELLGVEVVDVQANFFALGGHSLLGAQLIARIHTAFGIYLPLRRIFEAPTVAELSVAIEEMLVAEVEAMSEDEVQRAGG